MAKKKDKTRPFNNPFGEVKLPPKPEEKKAPPAVSRQRSDPARNQSSEAESEADLFLQSVGEVVRVRTTKERVPPKVPPTAAEVRIINADIEAFTQLSELVAGEGPFDIADSDEYIEAGVQGLDPRVMKRLRAGEYAVQSHLDLHGLTRVEAKVALEAFIHQSRLRGHRCVLVVTGRGLHSKDQIPVLREGVQGWLSRGRIARQVLGFTTARPQDGGAGAIYVLLRR